MYGSTTSLCVPIDQLEFWIFSCRILNPICTLLPNQRIPTPAKMEDRVWLSIGCPEQYMAKGNHNRLIGIKLWSWSPPFVPTSYSGEKLEFKTHHDPVKIIVAIHCFSPAPCSLCCRVKQKVRYSVRKNKFYFRYTKGVFPRRRYWLILRGERIYSSTHKRSVSFDPSYVNTTH